MCFSAVKDTICSWFSCGKARLSMRQGSAAGPDRSQNKMTRSKQIGNHKNDKKKNISKLWKTKRRVKDIDQIHEDLRPENAHRLLKQEIDYSLPGNAQHYCIHCARYFVDLKTLKEHFKTKVHKRRLKQLKDEPYTQEEAERAAGMGSYKAPKKAEVHTQEMPME